MLLVNFNFRTNLYNVDNGTTVVLCPLPEVTLKSNLCSLYNKIEALLF